MMAQRKQELSQLPRRIWCWRATCSISNRERSSQGGPQFVNARARRKSDDKGDGVLVVLGMFLLVAPVIEYGTVESTNIFTAIGNAEGGAGGD